MSINIHDITFYICVDNSNIDFKYKLTSKELDNIIQFEFDKKIKINKINLKLKINR